MIVPELQVPSTHNKQCFIHLCTPDAIEGATSPPFGKDGQSSPMMDKRKKTRKKSMNQKGDTAIGQAEGEL